MLGKQIRIKNIKRQREFIRRQLNHLLHTGRKDGDTQYRYLGEVLPEVKEYFKKEGFDVIVYDSDVIMAETKGMPINLFVPSRTLNLTEEELREAEREPIEFGEQEAVDVDDFLGRIFGTSSDDPKN